MRITARTTATATTPATIHPVAEESSVVTATASCGADEVVSAPADGLVAVAVAAGRVFAPALGPASVPVGGGPREVGPPLPRRRLGGGRTR